MILFKKLEVSDAPALAPFFEKHKKHICDFTVGGILLWRDWYDTRIAVVDGILYIRSLLDGATSYTFLGDDNVKAVRVLIDHCREAGERFELCSITDRVLESVSGHFDLVAEPDRDLFDYVYDAASLVTLTGRRYNGQRNHINSFKRLYPDWSFEEITDENREEVMDFYLYYRSERLKSFEASTEESNKVVEALGRFDEYRLYGGVLRAGGKIVAISLGETLGDMMFVHVEKALGEYRGAYPMTVNCFASHFMTPEVKYINREEDLGDEGLRVSKLSYHPLMLKTKYKVTLGQGE